MSAVYRQSVCAHIGSSGVWVTKAPFFNFSKQNFRFCKSNFRSCESQSYLTGITTIPVKYKPDIQYLTCVSTMLKNLEKNRTEKIGLVTTFHVNGYGE